MRGSSVRRGRRGIALVAALAGVFLSVGAGNAAAASAAATCSYSGGVVEITLLGDTAVLNKGNGSHINVNDTWCGNAATTSNTHTIIVYGNGPNDKLVVSLAGGDLEPGTEANDWDLIQTGSGEIVVRPAGFVDGQPADGHEGKSDLEILLDRVEYLSVVGNSSADKLIVGDGDPIILDCPNAPGRRAPGTGDGCLFANDRPVGVPAQPLLPPVIVGIVNLNDDDDADIWVWPTDDVDIDAILFPNDIEQQLCEEGDPGFPDCFTGDPMISVDGAGGDDEISGLGDHGTGRPDGNWEDASPLDDGLPPEAIGDAITDEGPDPWDGLVIYGGPGDDDIQGGEDNDVLSGGAGDDVIDGSRSRGFPGIDGAAGGAACLGTYAPTGELEYPVITYTPEGELEYPLIQEVPLLWGDMVDYSGSTGPITLDLDPGEKHPGQATGDGTDVVQNIEMVNGSPSGDTLSGDNSNNVFFGGAGDDTIAGDAGNDCEWGQKGNDTFDENEGTSIAQGGSGTENGSDMMLGNAGADDTITYSSRSTRVNVYLEPLPALLVAGGLPLDFPCLGVSGELPSGSSGTDIGGSLIFDGDIKDGADLNGDGDSWDETDESDCVWLDTENAVGGSGNDRLVADFVNNRADNEFTGGGGNDLLDAGGGNDTFHEGSAMSGADDMDGGTGGDICDYAARSNSVNVSLDGVDNDGEAGEGDNCGGVVALNLVTTTITAAVNASVDGEGNPQSRQNVENANGGSGADQLVGGEAGNVLNGNGGNDALTGGGSTDTLNGGDGDDLLSGGTGNDALNGGAGVNTADYSGAGAGGVGVSVNLTTGAASGEGNDTLSGIQNVNGSSFDDSLRGEAGSNLLNGNDGDDAIQAAAGNDVVNGGAGKDQMSAGAGNDNVSGQNGSDTMRGNAGNDSMGGGNGPDTLYGGKGNDTLSGGAGKDWHGGGPGNDRCNPGAPGLASGDIAVGCET